MKKSNPRSTTKEKNTAKPRNKGKNKGKHKKSASYKKKRENTTVQQHEDIALKTAMNFFADELLPYLGIQGKVVGYAPTEVIHLEIKRFL